MPEYKIGSALLCEYTRQELTGKVTVIGIYSGDILTPELPATFPLSAYIEAENLPEGTHNISIRFRVADAKFAFAAEVNIMGGGGAFPLPTREITVTEPGPIEVQFRLDGDDWRTVISKQLIKADPQNPSDSS